MAKLSVINNVINHPIIGEVNFTPSNDREIAKQGQDIYDRLIRPQVETRDNLGKIISIDIRTGNYEIDDNLLAACNLLQSQFPDAMIWAERIGFNAVYAVGGTLTKVELS